MRFNDLKPVGLLMLVCMSTLTFILAALPFHAFLSTWGGTAIGPLEVWKAWKEIVLLVLVPLIVVYLWRHREVVSVLWGRLVNRLIGLYVVLNCLYAIISDASFSAIGAGLVMNLRFFAMFLLAQLVMESHPKIGAWIRPKLTSFFLAILLILSLLALVQVTLLPKDFLASFGYDSLVTIAPFLYVDDNPDALRAFVTLRGPNELGSYLILPLLLAMVMVVRQPRNLLAGAALGLGVVALFLSGSRSAWIGAIVAFATLTVLFVRREQLVKWVKWGSIPAVLMGALLLWFATSVPVLRLAIFHSSPGDTHLIEGSTEQHWRATATGAIDALQHPFGQGVGVAGPASYYNSNDSPKIAENYFVQIAQEVGLPGLGLFIAINVALMMTLWRRRQELWPRLLIASFAGLTVINVFLHTWADDPTAMTWWAIAGLWAFLPQALPARKKM